ncbi:MAG: 23S rRNA (uracil(1939)-C(5))-methyltransferase RlmD [Lachnospiraceae bacterium]|nr:23S rRNA (uracil(1939)-C(5))-methyltransferase RlmD [Lachnospiraceae bacterium]
MADGERYRKGDHLTLMITDLAEEGAGVGHAADGFTFFVKDAIPGDTVDATVMKVKSRYGYAHLDAIREASEDRIEAPCPSARACGGCQLQVCDYKAELAWKERHVRQTLGRIGKVEEDALREIMRPICGADPDRIYRYRNKAQLPVAVGRDGKPVAGFYAARTHSVIPVEDCLLGDGSFGRIRQMIMEHIETHRIPAYDEKTGTGVLRHILVRRGHHSGQISVTLVINREKEGPADRLFPGVDELAECLFDGIPGLTSLSLNLNPAQTNVILGRKLLPVRGPLCIEDSMCGLRFRISPLSFYQVNTEQAERLYRQAMEFADLTGSETVIDLYCGIGTITLLAAQHAAYVIGVEIVPEAIEDAKGNAALNGITNVEFRVGKAEEALPALVGQGVSADVLIVDPPRAGLDPACIEAIRMLAPKHIVYVSCNPATLARDVELLADDSRDGAASYRLDAARPSDLFARTCHVEVCSLLIRTRPTGTENSDTGHLSDGTGKDLSTGSGNELFRGRITGER